MVKVLRQLGTVEEFSKEVPDLGKYPGGHGFASGRRRRRIPKHVRNSIDDVDRQVGYVTRWETNDLIAHLDERFACL